MGDPFVYNTTVGTLTSYAADKVAGGTGYNEDLVMNFSTDARAATVAGYVLDGSAGLANLSVTISYPANGAVTTSAPYTTGIDGSFTFSNIPFGPRALQVTSTGWTLGPKTVIVDKAQFYVPNSILNYSTSSGYQPLVLGQQDFFHNLANQGGSGATATSMSGPGGVFYTGSKLLVSDTVNNRVLIWNSMPATIDQTADFVLGQPNFTSNASGNTTSTLSSPEHICVTGSHIVVADTGNNRVLIWNSFPTVNQAAADLVLGQGSLSSPWGVYCDPTHIYVSDSGHNQILVWASWPVVSNQVNDFALGGSGGPSNSTMSAPRGISGNGTYLFVADSGNNRVLVWNWYPIPTSTQPAAFVLGQTAFSNSSTACTQSTFDGAPYGVAATSSRIAATDASGRVLIWNSMPNPSNPNNGNGQTADSQIGQLSFTACGINKTLGAANPSAGAFNGPDQIFLDTSGLFIAENLNNRVERWPVR